MTRSSVAALALILLPSCAVGNRADITINRHITLGQELMDLQAAHEAGALTDEEYAEIRLKLHDMLDLESDFGLSAIDPTE
jgi:hypothetical protein